MPESKEERKAYLRGKVDALETLEKLWSARNSINRLTLSSQLLDARRAIAALDIPQIAEHYGADRVEIPAPWEWDETFSTPKYGRPVFGSDHEVYTDLDDDSEPRLGLRKRQPNRVWFEAEEKPRNPQIGDWILFHGGWHQVIERTPFAYVCAVRHEEFDQSPKVVTQADVDLIFGGVK